MVNWAHVHLIVNEVPILGSLFAALLFIVALSTRDRDGWARAGILTLAVSVLGLLLAFFSGDPAVHVIEGLPQTSARALSEHHVRGVVATIAAGLAAVAGVVSAAGAHNAGGSFSRRSLVMVLVATVAMAAILGWTGLAGGRINHRELQLPADRESGPAHPH
jgi:hypothetical protein